MRKTVVIGIALLVAVGGLAAGASPASAHFQGHQVTFTAPVPGTALTPYWLDTVTCIGCNPDGLTRTTLRQVGYDQPVVNGRDYTEPCNAPTPPGAYQFIDIGGPQGGTLELNLAPEIDWDAFICAHRGPNGDELRADPTDTAVRWRVEAIIANVVDQPCPNKIGIDAVPVGCFEVGAVATQNWPYRLIAYNWSDIPQVSGYYHW